MSKKYMEFIRNSESITDKNLAIENFIGYAIDKLESMFEYDGLPETLPKKWIEYYLMVNGNCFITEVGGKLYAFNGGLGGEYDEYYQPTRYVISNPYLNVSGDFKIGVDGVLVRNDTLMQGMKPVLSKYGSLLVESDITTRLALVNYRIRNMISASDDKTNESAKAYLSGIENGTLATVGENSFFDGVKVFDGGNVSGYFSQLIEITQYIKASFYNEIGLNSNYNLKREYISTTENALSDDILLPLVDNMLRERQEGFELVNNMYGTNITVKFASSWETNQTQNEKEVSDNVKVISDNAMEKQDEETEEKQDEETEENQDEETEEKQDEETEENQDEETEEKQDEETEENQDEETEEKQDEETGKNQDEETEENQDEETEEKQDEETGENQDEETEENKNE